MNIIRTLVDTAIAEVVAEHPKWFSDKGKESARREITRKIMAAFRDGGGEPDDKSDAEPEPAPAFIQADVNSREARGYINLRKVGGAVTPHILGGKVRIPNAANSPAVFAFADMPPSGRWLMVTGRELAAWMEFIREKLGNVARRPIVQERDGTHHVFVPWPFPPSATGKVYERDEAA